MAITVAGLWVVVGLAWGVLIDPAALTAIPADTAAAVLTCSTVFVEIAWTRR